MTLKLVVTKPVRLKLDKNSSRKRAYISKQLFKNKVSSGRRTLECPQTKAVDATIVQWQFHVVKTYKCDTV